MRLPAGLVEGFLGAAIRPVLGPPVPVQVQRLWLDLWARGTPVPRAVRRAEVRLGSRRALRLDPPSATPGRAVLWLHGGAFMTGSYVTHRAFAAALALAAGARVYLLDYRLAPEHPHPAAVEDTIAALSLIPEERVLLGGDSAGGCLALLAALERTRELAGLAFVSPVVDLTGATSSSYDGKDAWIRQDWVTQGRRAAFGDDLPNLLDRDLSGLPRAVVHVGEHERLRLEGEQLAGRLDAELVVLEGMWHDVHLETGLVRAADEAVVRLGASVAGLLG